MDQITQQLKSGMSEFGNNENMPSATQDPDHKSFTYQVDKEVKFTSFSLQIKSYLFH